MTSIGHVFLVDDDDDVRLSIAAVLRYLGYGVSDFESAESFLQQAHRCSPAVLVLDMLMPKMTGLDLQKNCFNKTGSCPLSILVGKVGVKKSLTP